MKNFLCGAAIVALASVASADDVKFVTSYRAPGVPAITFAGQKVAAVFFSQDPRGDSARVSVEEILARQLTARGVTGVAAYRLIPKEEITNKDAVRGFLTRAGVKGIVALRVMGVEERKRWQPTWWVSGGYYASAWDYWGYGAGPAVGTAYYPGGYTYVTGVGSSNTVTDVSFSIEALVFHVETGQLIWAGMSEATNPKDSERFIKDLVTAMVKAMQARGLVQK